MLSVLIEIKSKSSKIFYSNLVKKFDYIRTHFFLSDILENRCYLFILNKLSERILHSFVVIISRIMGLP